MWCSAVQCSTVGGFFYWVGIWWEVILTISENCYLVGGNEPLVVVVVVVVVCVVVVCVCGGGGGGAGFFLVGGEWANFQLVAGTTPHPHPPSLSSENPVLAWEFVCCITYYHPLISSIFSVFLMTLLMCFSS